MRTFEAVPLRADLSAGIVDKTWERFEGYTSGELLGTSILPDDPWDRVAGDKADAKTDDLPLPNSPIRERFLTVKSRRANAPRRPRPRAIP